MDFFRGRYLITATHIAVAAAFSVAVAGGGIPALRQDWSWNGSRSGFLLNAWYAFTGWSASGFGMAHPYLTGYAVTMALMVLVSVVGSQYALALSALTIGWLCAFGGWRLARSAGAGPVPALASAGFMVFNPWVYNEVVAGHLLMVLAFGCVALLLAEAVKPTPNRHILALLTFACVEQIQFFLICVVIVGILAMRRAEFRLALATGVIAVSPMVVGVVGEHSSLSAIPYTLTWQRVQSVDPVRALLLRGYFTHYTASLPAFCVLAQWLVLALVAMGALLALRSTLGRILDVSAFAAWLLATGTKGPAAVPYSFLVTHLHMSAVYRELYDLVGLSAIAYAILAAVACRAAPFLSWLWAASTFAIAASWVIAPPSAYWIPSSVLPHVAVSAMPNSRFALIPPFQPLRYHGRGSGIDPAAYPRFENIVPVNEVTLSYPVDAALAAYDQTRNDHALGALSVSQVIDEPWFVGDAQALRGQVALTDIPQRSRGIKTHRIRNYLPELSLSPLPSVSGVADRMGFGEALFSDVSGLRGPGVPRSWAMYPRIHPIKPSDKRLLAENGWVDVRQAFAVEPQLAQGIGGVYTRSARAVLSIRGGTEALVYVNGVLRDSRGSPLFLSRGGYQWIRLPRALRGVRCSGECVVAATGRVPQLSPAARRPLRNRPVAFSLPLPWLAFATIPPSRMSRMLRYNVRFDGAWTAFNERTVLPHFRIDGTANAWIMPPHRRVWSIWLIQWLAAVEFAMQMGALGFGVWLAAAALRSRDYAAEASKS